jgi:hypothetical protein
VLSLIGWLRRSVPAEDASPSVAAVVHGDFRLDNLVFDDQLQVGGVASHCVTMGGGGSMRSTKPPASLCSRVHAS